MNYSHVSVIVFDAVFAAGVSMGASSSFNTSEIDFDGMSNPVIRGTSLAGVLRRRYLERYGEKSASDLFGEAFDKKTSKGKESRIRFHDMCVDTGKAGYYGERTSNAVDRHWGVVPKGALYSYQFCPPGTRFFCRIELFSDNTLSLEQETKKLGSIINDGLILGGKSNRGFGYCKPMDSMFYSILCLSESEEYGKYLDLSRAFRQGKSSISADAFKVLSIDESDQTTLRIDVSFSIPEGQDILVGNGNMQQMETTAFDGGKYWVLPGSSLRGTLKAFITGYAVRSGRKVAYDIGKAPKEASFLDEHYSRVSWLFDKPKEGGTTKTALHDEYPVASLFGSLHRSGRLHISDSFVSADVPEQLRMHVAVDAVTGGAIEGALFSNEVITAVATEEQAFKTIIIIDNPSSDDIEFIVAGLKAIDSGYLRLGSSKASGRLELKQTPYSFGKHSSTFQRVWREF